MADEVREDPIPETPPETRETSQPRTGVPASNYHILLYPEPPGPPTYMCLLCPLADCTEAEILAHLNTDHGVTPIPTPMAANPLIIDAEGELRTPQTTEGRTDA